MKKELLPSLLMTITLVVLLLVVYPLIVWGIAQLAPGKGKGATVILQGRVVGYEKEGQLFNQDQYFWSRPSAVDYNAAGSGGSNLGPTNPEFLQQVSARIDTFLAHNPAVSKAQLPVELVTASGSGLDPHLSPAAAAVQVKRVAAIRGISEAEVQKLVAQNTVQPLAGMFGPAHVNLLHLNLALDQLKK